MSSYDPDEPYEGSGGQRQRRRRQRIVAVVLSIALLLPIVVGAVSAVTR